MSTTIGDCKVLEFDIATGENKAPADKIKSLLNGGYDVDILYGDKTLMLIGTKEESITGGSGSESVEGGSGADSVTLVGGSDTDTTVSGEDTVTGGDGTDTTVGG